MVLQNGEERFPKLVERVVTRPLPRLLHAPSQLLHRHLHLSDPLGDIVQLRPKARNESKPSLDAALHLNAHQGELTQDPSRP